jgi:outer membrane protein TolC
LHSSNDHSPLPTLQKALRNHPLLKQYDYQIANNATRLSLAKNEKLPTLNALVYTAKQDGNDGDPRLLDNALFMGIRFYFPLLQREARGKIQAEKANFFKLINERRFTRDKLNQSYQLLKRELIFTKQQLALIQNELVLAERVQYGEDQKFKAGDSSLFLVNQREQAVAQIAFNLIKMQLNEKQVKTTLQYFNGVN